MLIGEARTEMCTCAQQEGLSLVLDGYPALIDEVIHQQELDLDPKRLVFVVCADPQDNTSDALISPFTIDEASIWTNLGRLERWIQCAMRSHVGARMRLYISEGFDESFAGNEVRAREVQDVLYALFKQTGDWDSLAADIRSD